MTLVAVLLGIGCIYLIINKVLVTKEMRRMAREIEQVGSDHSSSQLTIQMPNAALADLAMSVNHLQRIHQDQLVEHVKWEEEYKQSMADISHDLRTPLTAMTGYLKLLKKEGQDSEKQKEYVQIAYEKSDTLNQLVTSLFELARLESNAYQFEWESVDIKEVLEQELVSFYPQFLQQGTEPRVGIPEIKMQIRADHTAVQRIFNNLIQNALNHGAGDICINVVVKGGKVHVEVSNAAPNLTPDDLERVFIRAYTADPARNHTGGGMGLAIVKAFTEQMKGTVEAELKDDRFCITVSFALERVDS